MFSNRFFIVCGKTCFSKISPLIFYTLVLCPLFCALLYLYFQLNEMNELENRLSTTLRKGKTALERKDRKEKFLALHADADPYFLDQYIESVSFLQKEREEVQSLLFAFPNNSSIQERLKFLTQDENKLQFIEENIRTSNLIKETDEKQRQSVQMNESDLQQILCLIENIPVGPFEPHKLSPQFLIRDIQLKRISTPLQTEVFEVEMNLLKREFKKP